MAKSSFTLKFDADISEFASAVNRLPSMANDAFSKMTSAVFSFKTAAIAALGAVGSAASLHELLEAGSNLDTALLSLSVTAKQTGSSLTAMNSAVDKLSSDGQVGFEQTAAAMNKLLRAGYSVDQATNLLGRFKDASALNRREGESMGAAIDNMTAAVVRGNDRMLKGYGVFANFGAAAEDAGLKTGDLRNSLSSAEARATIFSEVMRKTQGVVGNAGITAATFSGQTQALSDNIQTAGAWLGRAMLPMATKVTEALAGIAGKVKDWIVQNQDLIRSRIVEYSYKLAEGITLGIRAAGWFAEALNGVAGAGKFAFGTLAHVSGYFGQALYSVLSGIPTLLAAVFGENLDVVGRGLEGIISLAREALVKLNVGGMFDGLIKGSLEAEASVHKYITQTGESLQRGAKEMTDFGELTRTQMQSVGDAALLSAANNANAAGIFSAAADDMANRFSAASSKIIFDAEQLGGKDPAASIKAGMKEASAEIDKADKVLDDFSRKMTLAAQQAELFGTQDKLAEQQVTILKNAITQLLEQGIDPADARIQGLTMYLHNLEDQIKHTFQEQHPYMTSFFEGLGIEVDKNGPKLMTFQSAMQSMANTTGQAFGALSKTMGQAFTSMIFGGQKWSEAFKNLGRQIVGMFAETISKMIVNYTVGLLLQQQMGKQAADTMIFQQAGVAFGNAYAPLAMFPPLALAAGIGAAGIVIARGLAFGAMGGAVSKFADGGMVGGPLGAPQAAIVHGGEMVLNPEQQRALFSGEGTGSAVNVNISVHAMDAQSVYEFVRGNDFQKAMVQAMEEGGIMAKGIQVGVAGA